MEPRCSWCWKEKRHGACVYSTQFSDMDTASVVLHFGHCLVWCKYNTDEDEKNIKRRCSPTISQNAHSKAAGPDKVKPTMMRSCADQLTKLLCTIWTCLFWTVVSPYAGRLHCASGKDTPGVRINCLYCIKYSLSRKDFRNHLGPKTGTEKIVELETSPSSVWSVCSANTSGQGS